MTAGTDQALTQLGTGPWSLLHILAIAYCSIPIVPNAMGSAFLAPSVPFSCRSPPMDTPQQHLVGNSTPATYTTPRHTTPASSTLIPPAVPRASNESDECTYESSEGEEGVEGWSGGGKGERLVKKCTEWQFDNSTFETTITSEFSLVCDRSYLRTSYQSIYMFGVFVGAPINGFLSDRFGRKLTLMVGSSLFLVMAPGSAWLPHLPLLLLSRFLLGVLHSIISYTSYILAVEVVEPRYRTATGFALLLGWAAGVMVWGALAYLERSWRLLQTIASLTMLPFLPLLWLMDESPRWLVVKGRREEALKVLRRAARWHRVSLPSDQELLPLNDQSPNPKKKVSCGKMTVRAAFRSARDEALVLLRTPRLRTITLLSYVTYLVAAMVYFGLSLSGGHLSDDPFVYMVLSGLMEVPAYTILIPVVQKAGRRIPGFSCFFFCAVALLAFVFIPKEYSRVIMTLAMVGKVTITGAFQIIIFFSSELFPTEVRSRGVGTCFMMSRIGSILSPIIMDAVGKQYKWVPSVVFGAMSLVAAFAILVLPETLGLALPDTIADLENRQHPTKGRESWCWSLMTRQKIQEENMQVTVKEGNSTPM